MFFITTVLVEMLYNKPSCNEPSTILLVSLTILGLMSHGTKLLVNPSVLAVRHYKKLWCNEP